MDVQTKYRQKSEPREYPGETEIRGQVSYRLVYRTGFLSVIQYRVQFSDKYRYVRGTGEKRVLVNNGYRLVLGIGE